MKQKTFISTGIFLIAIGMLVFQSCTKTADEFNPFNPENNLTENNLKDNLQDNDLKFARVAPLLESFSEPGDSSMTFTLGLYGPKSLYAKSFLGGTLLVATVAFRPVVYYHDIPGGGHVFDVSDQGWAGTVYHGYFTSGITHTGHINYTAKETVNYTATGNYYGAMFGNFSWNIPGDSSWIYSIP